jgi:N-acetylglucosamine kinase-like BadF-type ATPase
MSGASACVIGVDAGGSHTRATAVRLDGVRLASAVAGGANPRLHGESTALAQLQRCLDRLLEAVDPAAVRHIAVAVAGSTGEFADSIRRLVRTLGITGGCSMRSDTEVAFAAGTTAEHGIVVVAGTGAVIGEITAGKLTRYIDGNGWLVGDDGSGFWLGREAVRAVLAALDGRGPATALTDPVCAALGTRPNRDALISAIYARGPAGLPPLAPLVSTAAGDPVADAIMERAAECLLAGVAALAPQDAGHMEAVIGGGVLVPSGRITMLVCTGLRDRFKLSTAIATDGAMGAARLAIRAVRQGE